MTIIQHPTPNTLQHLTGQSGLWLTALLAVLLLLCPQPAHALTFTFVDTGGMVTLKKTNPTRYAQVRSAVEAAGKEWSSRISTPVILTISIDYKSLGTPIATSSVPTANTTYSTYRAKLVKIANPASATDAAVLKALPIANSITYTVRNVGVGFYGTHLTGSLALLKALGLTKVPPGIWEGSLALDSKKPMDFDPTDGITPNQYDAVGMLSHELGHVLGIRSAVDNVDASPYGAFYPHIPDLFRWSLNASQKPVRDLSADTVGKFFSPDGKVFPVPLHRGVKLGGSGQQACHWLALDAGLMTAQAVTGRRYAVRESDLTLMDAIGWTLAR